MIPNGQGTLLKYYMYYGIKYFVLPYQCISNTPKNLSILQRNYFNIYKES